MILMMTYICCRHVWELQLAAKTEAIGLRLKHVQESGREPPSPAQQNNLLGVFTISLNCIHPSSGKCSW